MQTLDIYEVFDKTDWRELRRQKEHLVRLIMADPANNIGPLDGLLMFLDAVQDAAELAGYRPYACKASEVAK